MGHVLLAGGLLAVTNNSIWVGREGTGDLTVSNGTVLAAKLFVGMAEFNTNVPQGTVVLAGGSTQVSSNLVVGTSLVSTGQVSVVGGNLTVSNSQGGARLTVADGGFTLSQGAVTADNLVLTNSAGQFTFGGGTLQAKNITESNGAPFVVGDGTRAAALQMQGGIYSFADGLVISSNATLTGCGTIIGSITNFGTIATNCGGPGAPSITQPPLSLSVPQGSNATFTVTAAGDSPLSYQWRFDTNTILSGATNSTYTVTNAQTTNAGKYDVVVTNPGGSVTSAPASLRVLVSPTLTSVAVIGTNFNFSFASVASLSYTVEYKTNLNDANWISLSTQSGSGAVLMLTDPVSAAPRRFYRVRVQ